MTNIPTHDQPDQGEPGEPVQTIRDVEAWFRRRTDIEERIREAKLGAGLRHLPSAHTAINAVWMWAALLAGNLSVVLQALTGIDENRTAAPTLRPAAPRTAVRPSPAGPPRPAPDPATATRPRLTSHSAPRPAHRGL